MVPGVEGLSWHDCWYWGFCWSLHGEYSFFVGYGLGHCLPNDCCLGLYLPDGWSLCRILHLVEALGGI